MGVINEELVRRRAEHNDGILPDLEEIALHQEGIEKIENLDKFCRHLQLLYLQNNAIGKMENLNKLKEVEYLNLAINNIEKIENVEGMESLERLDLTLNFISLPSLPDSLTNLKDNYRLVDLYLLGNPCDQWEFYRLFVILELPQLKQLDGELVLASERLRAQALESEMRVSLQAAIQKCPTEEEAQKRRDAAIKVEDPDYSPHSVEERLRLVRHHDAINRERDRAERERMGAKNQEDLDAEALVRAAKQSVYLKNGQIRQVNQGRYDFSTESTPQKLVVHLGTPKHLPTDMIDVDVQPQYLRVFIKKQLFQMAFDQEVQCTQSQVLRSKTTGGLEIHIPWVGVQKESVILKEPRLLVDPQPRQKSGTPEESPHIWPRQENLSDLPPPLEPIS